MRTIRANFQNAGSYAATHQPFNASALTGSRDAWSVRVNDYANDSQGARFELARDAEHVTYVVASYGSVIVWCDVYGDWHPVTTNRSVTTTRHQNRMVRELVRRMSPTSVTFWALVDDATAVLNRPTTPRRNLPDMLRGLRRTAEMLESVGA
jgi:hypothetical protein